MNDFATWVEQPHDPESLKDRAELAFAKLQAIDERMRASTGYGAVEAHLWTVVLDNTTGSCDELIQRDCLYTNDCCDFQLLLTEVEELMERVNFRGRHIP